MSDSPPGASEAAADRRVLYLRWRPTTFKDVVGQEHAVRTLRNAAASGRLAHAYLFSGPRGTGKTSIARILFKAANCPNAVDGDPCDACAICTAANEGRSLDLIEMDAASNRGIDDIRDLRERVHFAPVEGRYRVYIVDEAHELTRDAWDAFLKTLEEPPPHVIFVLATTEAHRVPPTIASRCQRFDFRRHSLESVRGRLESIASAEGLDVEAGVLEALGRLANGGLRDAISLLDQLRAYCGTRITEADARTVLGLPAPGSARQILEYLSRADLAGALGVLDESISLGADTRLLVEELLEHARGLLFAGFRAAPALERELGSEAVIWFESEVTGWRRAQLLLFTRGLADALARIREAQRLRLELELLLVEVVGQQEAEHPTAPSDSGPAHPPESDPVNRSGDAAPALLGSVQDASSGTAAPTASPDSPVAGKAAAAAEPEPPVREAPAPPVPLHAVVEPQAVGTTLSIDHVRGSWRSVVDRVASQNGALGAVLDAAQPMAVEGETVVLGVPYTFHVRMIVEPRNRRVIEETWAKTLGTAVRLDCRPSQDEQRPARGPAGADDPVVRAALEIFGGEVTVVEDDE